jgi:biofilm PGA synthesis protein PgaA
MLSLYGVCEAAAGQAIQNQTSLLAWARSERAAGHRVEALAYCQEVLAQWPDNRDARELNIQLLSELGASARARELASAPSSAGDDTTRARLQIDYATHETRWAAGEPDDPSHPYVEADAAVSDLKKVIADSNMPTQLRARARLDMLVALERGDRVSEVLDAYAALKREHVPLPPYAERAVAAAMMQRHRPREAIALYEDSIRRDAGPYDLNETDPRIGLASAYLEVGRAREALATVDTLAAAEPRWLHLQGVRGGTQNQRKVDADTSAAVLRQYAGMPSEAHVRLAALSDEAPGNAQLLRDLAMVELARGWPRLALETLNVADTLDERDVGAMLNKAEALRVLQEYAKAQAQLDQAQHMAARNNHVQDAVDAWNRERGWQFDLTHDNGRGNSPDYGDRDEETEATLASPLIDDHWRVLALMRTASAALPEGGVSRDRVGLGIQGYVPSVEFYLRALPAVDHFVRRAAFETGVTWAISDQWSLAADWSSAGADIPLRAQYYGISGKTFDTALQWRASELTSARLVVYQDRFSDGNVRKGWLANFVQRLHTGPNLAIDGGVEIGGSSNSEADRPYFNPSQDHSYALTGSLQNLLSQNDDRDWNERIDLAAGQYAERNYAPGWMASARYGQTFQPHAGLRFGWGLSWHWQPYDGRHESRVVLDLTMHWGE